MSLLNASASASASSYPSRNHLRRRSFHTANTAWLPTPATTPNSHVARVASNRNASLAALRRRRPSPAPTSSPPPTPPPSHPRLLHTSATNRASAASHYETLDVSRTASQSDIKQQFYKLSKRYHPDVNRDDAEAAGKKYQAVTEAYATLGNEQSRRAYDRTLSTSSSSPLARGGPYSYDPSDNANRRARASYAWSYARRDPRSRAANAARARSSASASSASSPGAGAGPSAAAFRYARATSSAPHEAETLFERLAAAERRREQLRARTSGGGSGAAGSSGAGATAGSGTSGGGATDGGGGEAEHAAHSASALARFLQVAGVFGFTYWLGTSLAAGFAGAAAGPERRIRADEEEEVEGEEEEEEGVDDGLALSSGRLGGAVDGEGYGRRGTAGAGDGAVDVEEEAVDALSSLSHAELLPRQRRPTCRLRRYRPSSTAHEAWASEEDDVDGEVRRRRRTARMP